LCVFSFFLSRGKEFWVIYPKQVFHQKKGYYENVCLFFPFLRQNLYHKPLSARKPTSTQHSTHETRANQEEEDGHTNVLIRNYERAKPVIVETGGTECRQQQQQQAFVVVWKETNFGRGIDF